MKKYKLLEAIQIKTDDGSIGTFPYGTLIEFRWDIGDLDKRFEEIKEPKSPLEEAFSLIKVDDALNVLSKLSSQELQSVLDKIDRKPESQEELKAIEEIGKQIDKEMPGLMLEPDLCWVCKKEATPDSHYISDRYFHPECLQPQEKEECTSCGSGTNAHAPDCRREEECKHENAVAWCGDCENILHRPLPSAEGFYPITQPKEEQLKPSEVIAVGARQFLQQEGYEGYTLEMYEIAERKAFLDFLDSVAEGKYKLEP